MPGSAQAASEAPMPAAMGTADTLPPLDERLPAEPIVMEVLNGIGEYGRTLRYAILGGGDQQNMVSQIADADV